MARDRVLNSAIMDCRLLIPSLFWSWPQGEENSLRGLPLAALETLLARGVQQRNQTPDSTAWLCKAFGVGAQPDPPAASLTLLADGGDPGRHYWLRADPAHLLADRDRLLLAAAGDLGLTEEQSAATTTALNQHFAADGMVFFAPNPARWYLRLARSPALQTFPPSRAIGRNIMDFLPSGQDGMRWRGILNEIQMLLHSLPANAERESRGEPEVNGLWLWGGGLLPHEVVSPFAEVWAEDPLARGLAVAAGVPCIRPPETGKEWLARAADGSQLVVLDALQDAALSGNLPRWRQELAHLEQAWFGPLKQALRGGRLSRLSLVVADGTCREFTVTGSDLWKFWRVRKSLAAYFAHS